MIDDFGDGESNSFLFIGNEYENDEFDHKEGFRDNVEDVIINNGFDFHDFGDETDFMNTSVFEFLSCLFQDMIFKRHI